MKFNLLTSRIMSNLTYSKKIKEDNIFSSKNFVIFF